MISVAEALDAIFALVRPLERETVPLRAALGRVMPEPVLARRTQPPFSASSMDGYAVPDANPEVGAAFDVIGESAAGARFASALGTGQAVRIFTGAPVPEGTARIVIQEDVTRDADRIEVTQPPGDNLYIRPHGMDFTEGQSVSIDGRLRPVDLALLAAMGIGEIRATRRPEVAIIATGNELVAPGEMPGADQIVASNGLGLSAMVEAAGGIARLLPIARDDTASLNATFDLAAGADLVVTIGGASVGDHDLVAQVVAARGMAPAFHKVAMRPGKPLMAGALDGVAMIGLPGNPVSSLVCGAVFVRPALDALMGLPPRPAPRRRGPLARALPPNGGREHYMRATRTDGMLNVSDRQDSALLSVLQRADALVVRPPEDPARAAGEDVDFILL